MFKRRFITSKQNNVIIYQSTQREVPKTTVTDTLGGWGANYVESGSTWDSNTHIGYLYFDGIINRIPDNVFEQNSTMIAILYIPETVTSIGKKVFYFKEGGTTLRSNLSAVNFNNAIKEIGQRAFQNNRKLEKLILPNSIEFLYQFLCNGCVDNLSEVTIGENFERFFNTEENPSLDENRGNGAFGLCTNLKTIHWNAINCKDFTKAEYSPFSLDSMGYAPITTVTFGEKVENIPNYLFYGCSNLTGTIELPETLENVNNTCFYKTNINKVIWNPTNITTAYSSTTSPFSLDGMGQTTSSIKYVRFGENVETIPCALFWKCEKITNDIVIPQSVKTIGNRAFQACKGIKNVICRSITPPNIIPQDENAGWVDSIKTNVVFKYYDSNDKKWYNLPKLEIYVPEISINEYKNDENWVVYENELKAIPQPIFDNFNGIDLGLKDEYGEPIIFADKNIGADNPEDIGYYFQWGDNTGYTEENIVNNTKLFDWSSYPYSNNGTTTMTKYNSSDEETKLRLCDDGAFMYTGGKWRMPTINELMLLTDETKIQIEWINLNGDVVETPISGDIKGLRFTSKITGYEGNSIFIPASGTAGSGGIPNGIRDVYTSGSIWSSNVLTSDYTKCDALYFTPQNNNLIVNKTSYERFYGRQIRGVLIK